MSRNHVRSQELDDESALPPLDDADNLGLVTRYNGPDEVSLDPTLHDELADDEPPKWDGMTSGQRAGVVLALLLIGLAYVFIVWKLRG